MSKPRQQGRMSASFSPVIPQKAPFKQTLKYSVLDHLQLFLLQSLTGKKTVEFSLLLDVPFPINGAVGPGL